MFTLREYEQAIPAYALPYIINGDASGLPPEDCDAVNRWYAPFAAMARQHGGHVIISADGEPEFTSRPAFGLPCDAVASIVKIVADHGPDKVAAQ